VDIGLILGQKDILAFQAVRARKKNEPQKTTRAKHALKGQQLLAQGNTLGFKTGVENRPVRA